MVHIAFFCLEGPPPGVGGETVLTDMRGVYRDLEAQGVPQVFEERGGVAYHKRLWSSAPKPGGATVHASP